MKVVYNRASSQRPGDRLQQKPKIPFSGSPEAADKVLIFGLVQHAGSWRTGLSAPPAFRYPESATNSGAKVQSICQNFWGSSGRLNFQWALTR
jgi:hypothetical protein